MKNKSTILIVDDESTNIDFIVNALKDKYNFKVANDGDSALKILSSNCIDLVLLDIQMPKINGYEVAKFITSSKNLKDIPFIFLTSKNDDDSIIHGFELGAKDYISKPFNIKELQVRVHNHLSAYLQKKKIQDQQKMLIIQSKVAAMGEMTGMLAHQWRQPLNVISVLLQEIQIKKSMDILTNDEFDSIFEKIKESLEYMSKTIDNFRDFFKKDKKRHHFNLINTIKSAYSILDMKLNKSYISHKIEKLNFEDENCIEITALEGEFKQVIINIINNAIEAFDEKEDNKRYINTQLLCNEDEIVIIIVDNAGGIDNKIIDKIFEPYSSTKLEQNGSGLGLYMSKMIIEKNMAGTIYAQNTNDGAQFTIKINKIDKS